MKTGKITYFGITIGAIASAYVSYVLNGVWSKGMDITTFTDTFLFALQHPSRNYYNTNTDKAIVYGLIIYGMAVLMYLTNKRKLMIGKEYGTAKFANIKMVNKRLADKDKEKNRILSKHVRMSTDTRRTMINNNLLVIGGSGAGKTFKDWPEMLGNIIPFIGGEEEKSEQEPLRLWGKIEDGVIKKATSPVITTQCIRVPVLDGHTAAVFVKFAKKPTKEQLIEAMTKFSGEPQKLDLPSAPKQVIQYLEEDNRPQVQLDVNFEKGMGISVGRLREDTVYDYKFVGLSHNTLRGAAGGAVLSAELLVAKGYIEAK